MGQWRASEAFSPIVDKVDQFFDIFALYGELTSPESYHRINDKIMY
jgi:hypothetical protein